jgi:hypothetical protein
MSGLFNITVQEARGFVAVPADIDALAVVIGVSSLKTATLSSFFLSGQSAVADRGYGDAVDTLTQIIEQVQPDGSTRKVPAALFSCTGTTAGSYGTIDVTGVTGACVVTVHSATHPFGTYEAYVRIGTAGTVGVAGITYQWSLDGGRSYSPYTALGTATTIIIPNSNVQFDLTSAALNSGDTWHVRTFAPAPVAADIDAAFTALANASIDFALVVCDWPMTATLAAHITTGQAALRSRGKRATVICRTRLPNFESSESETTWAGLVEADFAAFTDSTLIVRAAYGLSTDAMTGRQYLRSNLPQFAADVVRVGRSEFPDVPADRRMANFALVDSTGATIGHDEGTRGAVTGMSNDTLGNRFSCDQRLPDFARREEVFCTVPWTMYAADERIRNLPTRRIANALERTAVSAGTSALGGRLNYIPADPNVPGSTAQLTPASRAALHGVIYSAIKADFKNDIQNAADAGLDTGLVQIDPTVTVTGGNLLQVSVTIAPLVFGYLLNLVVTLAVQQ